MAMPPPPVQPVAGRSFGEEVDAEGEYDGRVSLLDLVRRSLPWRRHWQ